MKKASKDDLSRYLDEGLLVHIRQVYMADLIMHKFSTTWSYANEVAQCLISEIEQAEEIFKP